MSFLPLVRALERELPLLTPAATKLELSATQAWNVLVVAVLRQALVGLAASRGRDVAHLRTGRLFASVPGFEADSLDAQRGALLAQVPEMARHEPPWDDLAPETFGQWYESLLAARPTEGRSSLRKRTGSYYTPVALTELVVKSAFAALGSRHEDLSILDPALGAGAFLLQAGRAEARRSGRALGQVVTEQLFGVDISPLSVAVAEASLWLLADDPHLDLAQAGVHLGVGDALCSRVEGEKLGRAGVDFATWRRDGFDLVLGNPPWVAFAGRATQPVAPELRAHYRRTFAAFAGYPTLHALFVELAARLAPAGVVALLIPSPVADLSGYRHVRRALRASHEVCEPLVELGQDAFENVTQPCFALVARPREVPPADPERPFVLCERRRAHETARELATPAALQRLGSLDRLPAELFGEMGLQTNSAVSRQLLYRGVTPPADFSYALLEGRNVAEFELRPPRLFLKPDRTLLGELRCRLRDADDYRRVKVVVRQTAAITIAAAHDGTPFRNSLLAVFELAELPPTLVLGLLNSTLFRALHLARRRDARQGAFPQVKVQHLRALPAPPGHADRQAIASVAALASEQGLTPELRGLLDRAVYAAFAVTSSEAEEIARFVRGLSPNAGLRAPLA